MKKISYKILLTNAVITIVGIIAILLMVSNIGKVNAVSDTVVSEISEKLTEISQISTQYESIRADVLIHVISENDNTYRLYENRIAEKEETITQIISGLKTDAQADELEALDALSAASDEFVDCIGKVIEYSKADNKNMAQTYALTSMPRAANLANEALDNYSEILNANIAADMELRNQYVTASAAVAGTAYALMVIGIIFAVIMCISIVKPVKRASASLNKIMNDINNNEGNLTERINIKTKDEVGALSAGINKFLSMLQQIIGNIAGSSAAIEESGRDIAACVARADEGANDTSATMEELSAGMQEVSATVETVAKSVDDMKMAVKEISDNAQNGADYAEEIKNRAGKLQAQATDSKNEVVEILKNIDTEVTQSVEKAKQISEINKLTEQILGISSQTNLLALNASIEAARAGEAGKGFAVVADEIRVLADSSRQTANDIQNISASVVGNVGNLADNASKLLTFVNERVVGDYDSFEKVGEHYYDDALKVDSLMSDFKSATGELNRTMESVASSIDGISVTVSESAQGVTQVAQTTMELVDAIDKIKKASDGSADTIRNLTESVSHFKTY